MLTSVQECVEFIENYLRRFERPIMGKLQLGVPDQVAQDAFNAVHLSAPTLAKKQGLGPIECARNILLLGPDGHTIWQVSSDFDSDGDPFTNVIYENGELRAYRWDGGMYKIDMRSGRASPNVLAR